MPDFSQTQWGRSGDGLDAGNSTFRRGRRADIGRQSVTPMAAIIDGTSNTSMRGEAVQRWCAHPWWWFNGTTATTAIPLNVHAQLTTCHSGKEVQDLNCAWGNCQNNYSFMRLHPGGAQFALADGSVHFVPQAIDRQVYRSLDTKQTARQLSPERAAISRQRAEALRGAAEATRP